MSEKNTVFKNQLNAMVELAKFDITGDVFHLEEAHHLAYHSGKDGDDKTSMLNERRLSKWYEDGLSDREADYAIGMKEIGFRDVGFTVNAELGNTYFGEIVDAGGEWSVYQAVILNGEEVRVRHERKSLSSVLSGLINNGKFVKVFYPVAGMGIVNEI
ncbi:hypothetical protein K5D56_26165 [Pseudomonas cichorii]|nr:hypothetical protein [Pseudomonas cichorii]MBX8557022.1 hypothetical protein [Pseudomonas cichorii]MBX8592863.1 hypothetical protein [Pseudomonas cichorii]